MWCHDVYNNCKVFLLQGNSVRNTFKIETLPSLSIFPVQINEKWNIHVDQTNSLLIQKGIQIENNGEISKMTHLENSLRIPCYSHNDGFLIQIQVKFAKDNKTIVKKWWWKNQFDAKIF